MSVSLEVLRISQELARFGLDEKWLARATLREPAYAHRVLTGELPGCRPFFTACRRALGMTAAQK